MSGIIPDRHFLGHLRWTRHGDVWASWSLNPARYSRTAADAADAAGLHTDLFRSLSGTDTLLTGQLSPTSPSEVVGRMLDGIDVADCPHWAAEADAMVDQLDQFGFATRHWSLHVRLPVPLGSRLRTWARCAANEIAESTGVTPTPPTADEVAAYRTAADHIEARLPAGFAPRRLTEAEMVWQLRHAQSRDEPFDPYGEPELADLLTPSGRSAVGEPFLDPNGLTDLAGTKHERSRRFTAGARRRWLKVVTDTGAESWQSTAVLAAAPKGMEFPESAFLANIDRTGIPVDVAIRLTVRSRTTALRRVKDAWRKLNDQVDQVSEADTQHASQLMRVHDAADTLADYNSLLQRDDKEVECAPIIMVSTASWTDGDEASDLIGRFIDAPQHRRFTWARPIGAEADLWRAGQPAAQLTRQVRDYTQTTTGQALAATIPVVGNALGDDSGMLFGVNTSTPLQRPVYLDLFGNVDNDQSASLALLGEQGAGKTFTQKLLCGATVDRGGRMIATDITHEREWVTFAESLHCTPAVVDLAEPSLSLDPLRIFPADVAGPVAQAFLATLLNVSSTGPEGRTIAKTLRPAYRTDHHIDSLGELHRHLASTRCEFPGAADLADRIEVFADPDLTSSLGSAVFDPRLPALDADARAIIIATSNVSLPNEEELEQAHRYHTLGPEKLFGRAVYALIATLAKAVLEADRSDNAVFNIDEFHHYQSPEAIQTVKALLRYGRHFRGAVVVGTHDPDDLSSRVLSGLIRNRLVMRADPKVAERYAQSLGFNPDDDPDSYDDVVQMLRSLPPNESGHGVYRDSNRNVGPIRVIRPASESRYQAILSTPPTKAAR